VTSSGFATLLVPAAFVGSYFRAFASTATLSCTVRDPGSGSVLARGALSVDIVPTLWPLWDDAIVISKAGMMRSARLGVIINASEAALAAESAHSMSFAFDDAALVLTLAKQLWGSRSLSNVSSEDAGVF